VPQSVIILLVELVRVIVHAALGLVHPLLAVNQLLETLPLQGKERPTCFLWVFELLQVNDLMPQAFYIPQEVFLVEIQGFEDALGLLLEAIGANRIVFKVRDLSVNPRHQSVVTMSLVDAAEFLTEGLLPLQRLIFWV
jgi:hypothetical protein